MRIAFAKLPLGIGHITHRRSHGSKIGRVVNGDVITETREPRIRFAGGHFKLLTCPGQMPGSDR